MPKRSASFRDQLLQDLVDPDEAARYLEAAASESTEMLLVALRDVAESRQMSKVAQQAGVTREALYRMLSASGNPTYASLSSILYALGLRVSFTPISAAPKTRSRQSKAVRPTRG